MQNIELLDVSLLNDFNKLDEIDYWLTVLNFSNGWHYDLDIIWILTKMEELRIPRGATIIDAGAGLGVMQFILASRGFKVISLDFGERKIPKYAEGIFSIKCINRDLGDYSHEYIQFMTYGQRPAKKVSIPIKSKIMGYIKHPSRILYRIRSTLRRRDKYNPHYFGELNRDHSNFGEITFLKGIFNDIPLSDNSTDALISLSAFEHNTFDDMPGSVLEFNRVIKPGCHMIITTSAAKEKDWYHEPSKGWNFEQGTLAKWFNIRHNSGFNFDLVLDRIRRSNNMRKRISPNYRYSAQNGLPYAKLKDAKYCPVGIVRNKFSGETLY